MIVKLNTNR